MKQLLASVVVLAIMSADSHSQSPGKAATPAEVHEMVTPPNIGSVIRLAENTIFITVTHEKRPYKIDNLGRSFDSKQITRLLNAFYNDSKIRRINDIVVQSETKAEMPGERDLYKFLDQIRRKHKIALVFFPLPSATAPEQSIDEFAAEYLK